MSSFVFELCCCVSMRFGYFRWHCEVEGFAGSPFVFIFTRNPCPVLLANTARTECGISKCTAEFPLFCVALEARLSGATNLAAETLSSLFSSSASAFLTGGGLSVSFSRIRLFFSWLPFLPSLSVSISRCLVTLVCFFLEFLFPMSSSFCRRLAAPFFLSLSFFSLFHFDDATRARDYVLG